MNKLSKTIIFSAAFLLIMQSCTAQKTIINREVETTNDGKMLLGHQTKDQLLKSPYSDWYVKEHDEYAIDKKTVEELKKEKLSSYNMTVVLGTWCGDKLPPSSQSAKLHLTMFSAEMADLPRVAYYFRLQR